MKALRIIITAVILLGFSTLINAQDQIVLKSKKVIICKIVEVGVSDIKYKLPEKRQDLTFTISKVKIRKLIFDDGTVMNVASDELYDKSNYLDDKPNALKVNFLSPLAGSFQL